MLLSLSAGSALQTIDLPALDSKMLVNASHVWVSGAATDWKSLKEYPFTVFARRSFDAGKLTGSVGSLVLRYGQSGVGVLSIRVKYKGVGIGRSLVDSLLATYGTLNVYEIIPSAVGFWSKLGAQVDGKPIPSNFSGDALLRA